MSHQAITQTTTIAAIISTGDDDHATAHAERVRALRLQGHEVSTWRTNDGGLALSWAEIDQNANDGTAIRSSRILYAPNGTQS